MVSIFGYAMGAMIEEMFYPGKPVYPMELPCERLTDQERYDRIISSARANRRKSDD